MSFENIRRPGAEKKTALSDISLQAKLAEYAFKREHPDAVAPSHREIMHAWIDAHAESWRHVIDEHDGEQVDLKDPDWIARCYEMLRDDEGKSLH